MDTPTEFEWDDVKVTLLKIRPVIEDATLPAGVRIVPFYDRDFLVNPQKFMDAVVPILKNELHRLLIDGIKYEKLPDQEYSMRLFENPEIMSYLNNRLEVQKSVYDAIVYESEIERKFAEALDHASHDTVFVAKTPTFSRRSRDSNSSFSYQPALCGARTSTARTRFQSRPSTSVMTCA